MISEGDWKKFKKIKESALNKISEKALSDLKEGLESKESSGYGKFTFLFRLAQNYNKQIDLMFEAHSRSKALMQLAILVSEGLVESSEIEKLSDETKEYLNRFA